MQTWPISNNSWRRPQALVFLKPEPRITTLAPYGFVLKYFSVQVKDIPRAAFVAALQLEGIPCDGLFYSRSIAAHCSHSIRPISPR